MNSYLSYAMRGRTAWWRYMLTSVVGLAFAMLTLALLSIGLALLHLLPSDLARQMQNPASPWIFFAAIAVVFAAGVVNALLGRLVQVTGLSGVDRSLGLMFGLVRGVVLVLILVILGGLTELPQQDFWRDALLRRYAEQGVRELKPLLPQTLAHYVHV